MQIINGLSKKSNYQDLLKIIALIIMIIDHTGLFLLPEHVYLRAIGRVAFPLFCFFAGYNFYSRPKIHVLVYGIFLQLILHFYVFSGFNPPLNILFSIFIGQIYLLLFWKTLQNIWVGYIHVIILSFLSLITSRYIEYGSISIAIMVLGYLAKHHPNVNYIMASVTMCLSMISTLLLFQGSFNIQDYIISFIVMFIIYILMISYNYNSIIELKMNIISRNTLLIYFVHFVILGVIWKYYYSANMVVIF